MLTEDTIDWTREWKQQIRAEERQRALADERDLLLQQTEMRFGEACASALAPLLEPVEDHKRLVEIGRWILDCDSGDELLARVRS